MNERGNLLDLVGGFSSSSSIWLVSTWTSKCVSRLTLELKMAARLLQRRGDSELSKYSLSSQDKGLHAEDSAQAERMRAQTSEKERERPRAKRSECRSVPDNVMLCTMGVISASQHVRPRASAASTSGKNRTANICSCLRALLSLKTHKHTRICRAGAVLQGSGTVERLTC